MFTSPGDVAFFIGPVAIYYYGIIMAISLCIGVFTANFITKKFYPEINPEIIYDISPHIIIGAILGARIYYCLLNFSYYSQHLIETLDIREGGISIHGAILGGLISGIIYAKRHKLPILKLCDIFSYGLVLGQAIGRWGNFFNSEAFGRPTQSFLKLYVPIYKRPLEYMQYSYFHPTFLYESILDICIFLILFFVVRGVIARQRLAAEKKVSTEANSFAPASIMAKDKDGIIFFSYLILYSIVRILIEQIRIDSVLNVFGIPIAQIVSAVIILISTGFLIKTMKNKA